MIYIISCGSKKRDSICLAKDMYVGPLFKAALAYARARVPESNIFIISAKYGILRLNDVISPYNEKMGINGSITIDKISFQANQLGIVDQQITVLAGSAYTSFLRDVFEKFETPLAGLSLGYSIQFLKRKK